MRLYRALLFLYPGPFRREYGGEMAATFAARRREAEGLLARAALWLDTLGDVASSATLVHLDLLRQDVRYAVRALARMPGFTLTAVLVIALGVGANTAAFSLADFVLFRPLPFPEADRLVKVWQATPSYRRNELSPPNFADWRAAAEGVADLAAYSGVSLNLTGAGEPERLDGASTTADLFGVLGVAPALGRSFTADEDRPGASGTIVLSWDLWQSRFGGDREVIGHRVLLDDAPYTVLGVMPRDFHFPRRETRFWIPAQLDAVADTDRTDTYLQAVARLRRGAQVDGLRARLEPVSERLAREFPDANEGIRADVIALRDELSSQSRVLLVALCGAAVCILLVACANLANLLLARAARRAHELALRTALGAGRDRLVRQLLTESALLALVGGVIGIVIAAAALPLMARLVPEALPTTAVPTLDPRALTIAAVVSVLTGLAFGVVPAIRGTRESRLESLREGGRAGPRRDRLRAALVIGEVAATVVLLTSTGLLLRSLWRVQATDPGFRPAGVLALRTTLPTPRYDTVARRLDFYDRVLTGVRAIPGVSNAAYASFLPMATPGGIWPALLGGAEDARKHEHSASLRFVTPGYFRTMGIPLRQGRDVEASDGRKAPAVAVVSESFARSSWPGQDPLGRRFGFGLEERTVVGVVGDVRVRGLERESEPQVYLPAGQVDDGNLTWFAPKDLVVRLRGDGGSDDPAVGEQASLAAQIAAVVHAVDPAQPVSDIRPLTSVVEDQTASRSVQLRLLGLLAAVAALLAGVGIHGLLAFTVAARTREIGVRVALGAAPAEVAGMVVGRGMRLVLAGLVPGVVLAYLAARAMSSLLVSVQPVDPPTYLAVLAVSVLTAAAGCLLPTVRAVRLDPMAAIRAD
jgi:predicted permease